MKAKDTSLIGMIIGAVCLFIVFGVVIYCFCFKENFNITTEQALALILIAMSPSIPFCPIYISTWLDKIISCKQSKKEK